MQIAARALRLVKGARPAAAGEEGRATRRPSRRGGGGDGDDGDHGAAGDGEGEAAPLPLVASLLVVGLVLALVVWRYAPPPARGAEAPADEFSAARAHAVLARLLGGGAPHPTGSAANAAVRGRLLAELRRLGLEPVVDSRLACRARRCATVHNVLARIPGSAPGLPAVLLATHYDSVAAGPGASDDASGVAASLEAARAVLAGPKLVRDVLLLVDDGEEQALLGAQAFVDHTLRRHLGMGDETWARDVGAVVNLEARGTTGPSLLFELSRGNARLVAAAARSLRRPATSSIYYAIYQRLPNDTDLTVFKEAELPGVNFGFVGAPLRYHTPRDDLRHADRRTLQHHGDNALAMVRALAGDEGSWQAEGDAVFFDVLTVVVLRWPAGWAPAVAILALALVAMGARRLLRGEAAAEMNMGWGRGTWRGPVWGALAVALLLALAAGLARGLVALLRELEALPYHWIAEAGPLEGAFWGVALLAAGLAAGLLGRRLTAAGAWSATWTAWALIGLVLSFVEPSMSYPFVGGALVAGALAAGLGGPQRRTPWLALAPLAVAAVLLFPFAWFLYTGMGTPALLGVAFLVALVLTGLLPALATAGRDARWAVAVAALSLIVVSGSLVLLRPPFTSGSPQPMALVELHLSDETRTRGTAPLQRQWLMPASYGSLPAAWLDWSFSPRPQRPYPWQPDTLAWVAEAPGPSPAAPELAVVAVERTGDGLLVRARLRSPRGAPWAGVLAPGARWASARVEGVQALSRDELRRDDESGWIGVEHVTLPAGGAPVELRFRGAEPVELWLWDGGPGVSPAGAALLAARPDWGVPIHRGDRTLVARRLVLGPAASDPAPAQAPPAAAAAAPTPTR